MAFIKPIQVAATVIRKVQNSQGNMVATTGTAKTSSAVTVTKAIPDVIQKITEMKIPTVAMGVLLLGVAAFGVHMVVGDIKTVIISVQTAITKIIEKATNGGTEAVVKVEEKFWDLMYAKSKELLDYVAKSVFGMKMTDLAQYMGGRFDSVTKWFVYMNKFVEIVSRFFSKTKAGQAAVPAKSK